MQTPLKHPHEPHHPPHAAEVLEAANAIAAGAQAGPVGETPKHAKKEKPIQLLLELLPLIAFFLGYKFADMTTATYAIMGVTAFSICLQYFVYKRIPVLALITAGVVAVFGTLTLVLHNDTFIKMKPTMIYSIFALILIIGRQMGKNPLQHIFGQMFNLSPRGWRLLSWRWAIFFVGMAIANEVLWRHISEGAWVNFKVFGALPLTLLFGLCQFPLLTKETAEEDPAT